jgi:hypothetical protein
VTRLATTGRKLAFASSRLCHNAFHTGGLRLRLVRLQGHAIQKGASPFRADVLRPVTDGNCVAARQGGEQPKVNDQSVGDELDSAWCLGEPASQWRSPDPQGKSAELKGNVSKRWQKGIRWLETE